MVEEIRHAARCLLCRERKEALSPYTIDGVHDTATALPDNVVEVIHRISTDSGRLREAWFDEIMATGLSDAAYVEIVGVIATTIGLDTFDRALGLPLRPIPTAKAGEPTRHRPSGARKTIAWVPTLAQEDVGPEDPDPYPGFEPVNIHFAMSLVPEEVAGFFELDQALYLPQAAIRDLDNEYRALTHSQLELIAARVAALNQCFY
jgi:alkylhydroperoxidase family enzyme